MKMRIENVRAAFPNVFEAKAFEEGKAKFSLGSLITRDHPQLKAIESAMISVAKEKWGAKAADVYKELKAAGKLALRDGDSKASLDGYAGNWFINASSDTRPLVLDADKSPLTKADGKPYGGCYVNVIVEFWAQDNKFGKRINAQLKGVQFVRDGEPFGSGGSADVDEFDSVAGTFDSDDISAFT